MPDAADDSIKQFLAQDDAQHPYRAVHRLYAENGSWRAWLGAYQFVYDVTERLRAEERLRAAEDGLRQAQKMEALGQLTSGVAHDFNNLLAVFATALQLLERTGQPASARMIEAMRRAVTRGTGLPRQLLAVSRRRPVNAESIDVVSPNWPACGRCSTRRWAGRLPSTRGSAAAYGPLKPIPAKWSSPSSTSV